jgi:hypothetical protein
MKRILSACLVSLALTACGGGKHEPEIKDSKMVQPDSSAYTDSGKQTQHTGERYDQLTRCAL